MINYSLVENVLAPNPNGYVAVVSSSETKDLNAVIDFMIAEGTGLTRPQALAYIVLQNAVGSSAKYKVAAHPPSIAPA